MPHISRRRRALVLSVVSAEKLAQIWNPGTMPRHAEHLAGRRDVFAHHAARLHFVFMRGVVPGPAHALLCTLHLLLIGSHGGRIPTQLRRGAARARKQQPCCKQPQLDVF